MTPEEFAAVIKNEGGKTATEEELTAFEQKIGASLPQRLRQFLKLSSGGLIFDPPVVYLDSQDRDLRLRHMSDLTEIEKEFTTPRAYPLPRELLRIGNDSGGNSIMICLREDRFGEIFMLHHEMVAYEGEPEPLEEAEDYGLVTRYSQSFERFRSDLRIEDD
ncbi:SMI1/KNR4 family protein [Rhizobium phaseoli]|uniref:SMI1/KNR4 family protein n=1 Tax=Rhizobium phaseoli TaxID=396 RepID=UPI0007EA612B|nr:SMI1/KNR4 family protein [Rhizobium phaseoli]ANL71621.1 SMI1/KNR4 family protein [Rhizobium phaseoli]